MTKTIEKDSTNVSVEVYIVDSTTGQPELGVVFNTAGIDLNYRRDGAVVTSITEINLSSPDLTDAHEDGGFLEVANGRYRLDVPDAAFATGVNQVTVGGTITGMVVIPLVVDLVDAYALATDVTTAHTTTDALISGISTGAGGLSVNTSGVTVTTGTETNADTDTYSAGTIHIITAAGGITLFEYNFDLSEYTGTASKFIWTGYVQTAGDSVVIQYYNWPTTAWVTIDTLSGVPGTTLIEHSFTVPVGATGTGTNFGLAKLRFTSSSTTNIGTDRVWCEFSTASGGITNGSTITLAATQTNQNFVGENWILALGGQDISGSYFHGASVTGLSSGTSAVTFEDCEFGAGTYPPGKYVRCGFGIGDGRFTAESAGQYKFVNCYSVVEGSGTPDFTFSGIGSAVGVNNRGWKGGSNYTLDGDCTLSHEVLAGGGQTITTGGADVELRGTFRAASIVLGTATSETVQIVGVTGPVAISGSPTAATVNVYGVTASVTTSLSGATITDSSVSAATVALTGADSDTLETLSDQLDTLAALSGEGAFTGTLTVDDGAATALEGVVVNARRGGVLKASGTTDVSGEITNWVFGAFTYDLASRISGYEPGVDTIAVSADAWTKTISLTANSISAPPSATTTTGVMTVYDEEMAVESGVTVTVQIQTGPGTDGLGYDTTPWAATSDANGLVEFAGIAHGAVYKIWRGDSKADAETFTAPTTGTSFDLAEVLGQG